MSVTVRFIALSILGSSFLVGCGKDGANTPPAASATPSATPASAAATASAAPAASQVPATVTAPVTPPADTPLAPVPASFDGATPVVVENAVGVGCETKVQGEWLRLTCFKKNGTGGHPKRAVMPALGLPDETTITVDGIDGGPATAQREITPEDSGMMHVLVPWKAGYKADGFIEWTDSKYLLHVDGASAKLGWDVTVKMRKACAELERAQQELLTKTGGVAAQKKAMPRLGRCQPAGTGSWAVAATEIKTTGDGPNPMLHADLEMVWVDYEGGTTRSKMGSIEFVPGSFQLPRIVSYDYDDDGLDEAIVTYELGGFTGTNASVLPPIWKYDGKAVTAYGKSPALSPGGVTTEQLDSDMRPDLGSYGPYLAYPTATCSAVKCPERITGPKLFAHSLPDGSFSLDDDAVKAAGKRMCSQKPAALVAGTPMNVQRTAQNVACSRLWGVTADAVAADLKAHEAAICGSSPDCELMKALTSWANAKAPFEIH